MAGGARMGQNLSMARASRTTAAGLPLLKAVGVQRLAEDSSVLLDDVTLELAAGDRLALAGPSGAGKSLLLRALALLDPLDRGRIEWRGAVPVDHEIPRFRRRAIYLAQRPIVDEASVVDQLERPWRFASAGGVPFDRERAAEMLTRAERAPGFLEQMGVNLSGGEAQLLALVRALLLEPHLLLLDEPTAAMDARTRGAAEALLEDWLRADPNRAWVWVSHDPSQLERSCRRELKIDSGRLLS